MMIVNRVDVLPPRWKVHTEVKLHRIDKWDTGCDLETFYKDMFLVREIDWPMLPPIRNNYRCLPVAIENRASTICRTLMSC